MARRLPFGFSIGFSSWTVKKIIDWLLALPHSKVQGGPEAEAAYLEKSESWDGDGPPKRPLPPATAGEKTTPENIANGHVGNDEP